MKLCTVQSRESHFYFGKKRENDGWITNRNKRLCHVDLLKALCKLSYYESFQIMDGLSSAENENKIVSADFVIATSDFAIPFENRWRCLQNTFNLISMLYLNNCF